MLAVHFYGGRSVVEATPLPGMNDKAVTAFLKKFSPGGAWSYEEAEKTWRRDKGEVFAVREPGNDMWIWIKDQKFMTLLEKGEAVADPPLVASIPPELKTLAPALAPLAEKYKADRASLEEQRKAALKRAEQDYFAALDAAEKSATSSGDLKSVAAIFKEREALTSGEVSVTFPPDLPRALATRRKTYSDSRDRVAADVALRQRRIDADYLRSLGALQARSAPNSELFDQIAAEKKRIFGTRVDE